MSDWLVCSGHYLNLQVTTMQPARPHNAPLLLNVLCQDNTVLQPLQTLPSTHPTQPQHGNNARGHTLIVALNLMPFHMTASAPEMP